MLVSCPHPQKHFPVGSTEILLVDCAATQIRLDTEGRAYYRRKLADGKTRTEAMRCLKRRISDARLPPAPHRRPSRRTGQRPTSARIQRAHVELYIRHLGSCGLMSSSINTMMHGLRGFFRFAHIDGLIPSDPAVYARLPKIHTDESRTQGLDRLELIGFLQVAQTIRVHHGALAFLCAYYDVPQIEGRRLPSIPNLVYTESQAERMIHMTATIVSSGARIESARERLGMSQRALARKAGLSQPTLSRIESGERTPKMSEIILIAGALGCSVSEISEHSAVRDRVVCFARAENGSDMSGLRGELVHLLELDAYLDEYGIN